MIFKQVKTEIDRGILGENKGLPMGLPRLGEMVNFLQKGRYDLVAGKTSAGKTAFIDQCYVKAPFQYYLENKETENIKIDWLYFSLEISPTSKYAKFAASELYTMYQIRTSSSEILSKGKHKCSPELREAIDTLDPYFEELEKHMHVYTACETAQEIEDAIMKFIKLNGTLKKENDQVIYTPNHPNHYVIIIIDTINLLTVERGSTKKNEMDKLSKFLIKARNIANVTPVVAQQYNAEIVNPMRIQQKRVEPIVDDLEDSKHTSKDCDTYFSVFDPSEMGLPKSPGNPNYDLRKLQNRFRSIKVHKNRDGDRDFRVGCQFVGEFGMFVELPPPDEMTSEDYDKAVNDIYE